MAYGGNHFGQFLGTMLGLREQRLKEQLAEEEMKMQGMQALGKGIGGMLGNMGQAFGAMSQQNRQDAMANSLMNESANIPRAQAVDPSMQGPADSAAQGMPGFHTGGMDEMTMRMKMQDMRNEQLRAQAYRDQVEQTKAQHIIKQAQDSWKTTDGSLQKELTNSNAYIKNMRAMDEAMAKAEDPMAYQSAVDSKIALNQAAIKRGMEVAPIDPQSIPPFMTPDEKSALAAQQQAVQASQQALIQSKGMAETWAEKTLPDNVVDALGVNYKDQAIKEAQQKFELEQSLLKEMPGGSTPAPAPAAAAATGQQSTGGSKFPVGHKQVNPATGKTRIWNGTGWEYQ